MIFCLSLAHSAQASFLCTVALFYKELFSVCSNGAIPNLKFVGALMNVHKASPIYHHPEACMSWAPAAGGQVRKVAKHWRDLAADEDKLEICLRKAWGLQTKIDWATSKDFRIFGSLGFRGDWSRYILG